MAREATSKTELVDQIDDYESRLDEIADVLADADDAGLTREEVIERVRTAASIASDEELDETESDDDDEGE